MSAALGFVTPDTPELADSVLEVVEAHNEDLRDALRWSAEPPRGGLPGLGARLLPLIEQAASDHHPLERGVLAEVRDRSLEVTGRPTDAELYFVDYESWESAEARETQATEETAHR